MWTLRKSKTWTNCQGQFMWDECGICLCATMLRMWGKCGIFTHSFLKWPLEEIYNLIFEHLTYSAILVPNWTTWQKYFSSAYFFTEMIHPFWCGEEDASLDWQWAATVSLQWLQPKLDCKRSFIAESFLRHSYIEILITTKIFHRVLFEKICPLKAENSLFLMR